MAESFVQVEAVSFRIGDALLVRDVSLDVRPGERVAIVGPNGAGKSTLLHLVAGDLAPSTGRVLLDGADVAQRSFDELARLRSMLTQRSVIDVPYTAAQIVAMGRFPHRHDANNTSSLDQAAVRRAMAVTDTTRFSTRVFGTLSGGEKTRVSLARVLAQEAPIVLLDEPTTALDLAHQQRVLRTVGSLGAEGRAVIAVLHDLNSAAAFADVIHIMHGGSIVAFGDPKAVLSTALLSDVFATPLIVVDHPLHDGPLVLPARHQGTHDRSRRDGSR